MPDALYYFPKKHRKSTSEKVLGEPVGEIDLKLRYSANFVNGFIVKSLLFISLQTMSHSNSKTYDSRSFDGDIIRGQFYKSFLSVFL